MSEGPGVFWMALSFLLVIGPLVFIHELGHYWVGRWFGVRAETFSIGFGREVGGWTDKRGTRWKVGWLPLGGYVKFAGDMNPASTPTNEWLSLPAEERSQTFQAKAVWQRFLIVSAGPITNFLFAILLLSTFYAVWGQFRTPPIISAVAAGTAAADAGLRPNDRVVRIDGEVVSHFEDISRIVSFRPEETLVIDVMRDGQALKLTATPKADVLKDEFGNEMRRGLLGIPWPKPVLESVSLIEAPGLAVRQTWIMVSMTVEGIGQILSGSRSVKELGGPLKIAKFSGEQASLGLWPFITFVAVISINLGFINLLPIPLLDGGHLLFYLVEAVRRKPLKPEVQEWAFRTGLAALLALMIFVTFNDLTSFGLWSRLGGLIG